VRPAAALGLGVAVLAGALPARAHPARAEAPLFEPPPPGSYELPVIDRVREHVLLDSQGRPAPLLGLRPGQVALLAFVYGSCADACPLAFAALQRLDRELAELPGLGPRVRLAAVSFDPLRDTPERMGELRRHLAPRHDWRFLTAASPAEIEPVLADFGQDVTRVPAPGGERAAGHTLRVFLVDAAGAVRNVYSAGFLEPAILRNDAASVLGLPPAAWSGR
jgi:cytochrome oxidase Cu insertion factor (SCO1/SenC/PrrC family)